MILGFMGVRSVAFTSLRSSAVKADARRKVPFPPLLMIKLLLDKAAKPFPSFTPTLKSHLYGSLLKHNGSTGKAMGETDTFTARPKRPHTHPRGWRRGNN